MSEDIAVADDDEDDDRNAHQGRDGVDRQGEAVRTYEQRTTIRYQVSEISAFYPDCW